MAEVKRGMGRGILRFAPPKAPEFTSIQLLTGLVNALSLTPDDSEIFAVTQAAVKVTVDAGSPASCIDVLLTRCEANWKFGKTATSCAVALCNCDAINDAASGSFRNLWLKKLQSLYQQEDRLRTEKPAGKWLSCVSLMCQAFSQLLMTSGTPLELLVNPVVQLLQLCLSADASDDERACAAVQLLDVGKLLSQCCDRSTLCQLQKMIREIITSGSGSPETRLMLISVLERFASAGH